MKTSLLCAAVAILGLAVIGTPETEAGRRYGYSHHHGHNHGYRSSGRRSSFYYGGHNLGISYGSYYRAPVYHDTSHYDYHGPSLQRHGNHYDYVPGHYDYHRTGHWDY